MSGMILNSIGDKRNGPLPASLLRLEVVINVVIDLDEYTSLIR